MSTAPAIQPPDTPLARFDAARQVLLARNLERGVVIDDLFACLVAGQHIALLGPPGTGKSRLARDLVAVLGDLGYFEYLLTRFTEPHELFGGVDLEAFKAGTFRRIVDGMLPTAQIAFLDEAFKANSAILNALLAVLNERLYHNGGTILEVPLQTAVLASNEMPPTDTLALWDRCLVRHVIHDLQQVDNVVSIIQRKLPAPIAQAMVSLDDVLVLRARSVELANNIDTEIAKSIARLRNTLASKKVVVSTRRLDSVSLYLGAVAALAGAPAVTDEHLARLDAVLWHDPDQIPLIRKELNNIVAVWRVDLRNYRNNLELLQREWDTLAAGTTPDVTEGARILRELKMMKDTATAKLAKHVTHVDVSALLADIGGTHASVSTKFASLVR